MKNSLTNRIIVGKAIGLFTGILVFFLAPLFDITLDLYFGLGLVIFYMLVGTMIAFVGLFDRHPVLDFKISWWLSGILVGVISHTMLTLLTYDQIIQLLENADILGLQSPWWTLLDGVILGLIMSFAECKIAGKGDIPLK